jgi:hypothetical protein
MRDYFAERDIDYIPWGDEPPYFTNAKRLEYFSSVPVQYLHNCLIFFDPDVGLAGKNRDGNEQTVTAKHLTSDDLRCVVDRMTGNSLAVVYQHFPREEDFWNKKADEIRERIGGLVAWVADPAVCFLAISRDASLAPAVDSALQRVASFTRSRTFSASR